MHLGIFSYNVEYGARPDELARAAEERGFESFWVGEHTHIPAARQTPYPGGEPLPKPYYHMADPFVSLMAAAGATSRIKLGTGICLVVEHDPIVLAKTVATLDWLSNGRVLFGIGVPDRLGSLIFALLLGALAFCGLGIGVTALIKSAEGASAVVNAIYLPAAFLAGAFFSPHHFPSVLRAIADVLPLTYFLRLVRNVMLHGHDIWSQGTNVAVVAAWGLLGVIIAVRAFRWEPHEG